MTQRNPIASPDRRRFIRQGSVAALAAAATAVAEPVDMQAQKRDRDERPPAMRSADHAENSAVSAAQLEALPALEVLALNRMGFGPRRGDLKAFRDLGENGTARLRAYVEQQLNPEQIDDSGCQARLEQAGLTTLGKSRAQLWQDHVITHGSDWGERTRPVREVETATYLRALYSKRQLVELLADFWHNHFNVYAWDYWPAPVWVHYDRDVVRGNMLGNFRKMLEDVAQSPAMLYYLDNQTNEGGNPNENYARELFELHTLGAENYLGVVPLTVAANGGFEHPAPKDAQGRPLLYVDADVYGATTCFTGWRVDRETGLFAFDANVHFPYQKFVLGRAIPDSQGVQDGHDVLDMLAQHPGTARHICRKLCTRLISDDPPDSIVDAAAQLFLDNHAAPDQLQQVTRAILLSDEFKSTWGRKFKRPFEYIVSAMRAVDADWEMTDSFRWRYQQMGQKLFGWHAPNGYPDVADVWSSTFPFTQRWRMINWLSRWKYEGSEEYRIQLTNPAWATTAIQVVDYWSAAILGRTLPESERIPIIEFMAHGRNPEGDLQLEQIDERLIHMIALLLMSPSFQLR